MSRLAVAPLTDGRLEFWMSNSQGGLDTSWKIATDPNADWASWRNFLAEVGALPGGATSLAVAPLTDGRLQIWACTTQGGLFCCWKLTPDPDAAWSGWRDFLAEVGQVPGGVASVAVAALPDGRLELWAATIQGKIFSTWQLTRDPNSNWAPWFDVLANFGALPSAVREVAMAPLSDGRLEAWVVTANGGLFSTWKVTADPNADWSPWFDFFAYRGALPNGAQQVAMVPLSDGRLEAWVVTADGKLFSTWKVNIDPNADWSPWFDFLAYRGGLPGPVRHVAMGRLPDKRVEAWVETAQGEVFTTWKLTVDSNADWAAWVDFVAEIRATIEATFAGTTSFSTANTLFAGPYVGPIEATMVFGPSGTVSLVNFNLAPVGGIIITKTGGGMGTFNKAAGSISLPIELRFDDTQGAVQNARVIFDLTTGNSTSPSGAIALTGAPLDAITGSLMLVGASRFVGGGVIDGTNCGVTATGTLAPIP